MEMDITHVAKLARLRIPEEKMEKMRMDLNDIVKMVENLPNLSSRDALIDLDNTMELREDVVKPSLPRDEILKNAPHAVAGCIVVPKTVE